MENPKKSIDKLKEETVNAESIKGGGGYIPMANMNPGVVEQGGALPGMQMETNFNLNAVESGPFQDMDNTIHTDNNGSMKHPDSLGDI